MPGRRCDGRRNDRCCEIEDDASGPNAFNAIGADGLGDANSQSSSFPSARCAVHHLWTGRLLARGQILSMARLAQ